MVAACSLTARRFGAGSQTAGLAQSAPWRLLPIPWLRRHVARVLPLLLAGVLLLLAPAAASASLFHLEGPPPLDLGLHDGNLSACPSPAHCACDDWPVSDPGAALDRLRQRLAVMEGAVLQQSSDTYIHATVSSRLFGFVDDLELYADSAGGRIQAISRSRLGDSDLGVNARRLEALRQSLEPLA